MAYVITSKNLEGGGEDIFGQSISVHGYLRFEPGA